jgi:cytochrome bd-type quinol oxidase subunit 2
MEGDDVRIDGADLARWLAVLELCRLKTSARSSSTYTILVGTLFVLSFIPMVTVRAYRVFRGKAADQHGHR